MTDISNKALAILVGIAIIVVGIGILSVPKGGVTILGAAVNTTSGTANVTIQSVTQITLVNNTVDFGTGFVNASDNACILESNSSSKFNSTNGTGSVPCQGFNAPAVSQYFVIENNGNINVTLTINGTFATARNFLCNSTVVGQNCTLFTPEYKFATADHETGSCDDVGFVGTSFTRHLNTSPQTVCTNFDFSASSNALRVPVRLAIPRDSIQGARTDSVLFTATS